MLIDLNTGNLHSFIIYGFLGSLISYLLVKLLIKVRGINNPKEISKLMFIPLVIPFLAIISSAVLINNQCPLGISKNEGLYGVIKAICSTGFAAGAYLTPFLIVGFCVALIKGLMSLILRNYITRKDNVSDTLLLNEIRLKLEALALEAGVKCPNLLVTKENFARCYTFGYKNPCIVISQGVIKYFEEEQIEAILAHEIGHIVRADSFRSWIGQMLRDSLFFSPLVFVIFKELKIEHEKAADDIAIRLTKKPIVFAETLLKYWKFTPKNLLSTKLLGFLPETGFAKDVDCLAERVKRAINENATKKRPWATFAYSGGIIFSTLGILMILC